MYEITVSADFERWFESLNETVAERVVGALELLRATGPELDPVHQSRLLLWYDGTGAEAQRRLGATPEHEPSAAHVAIERVHSLMSWQRAALACFDSQPFRDALARLDDRAAAEVLDGVAGIRSIWSAAWVNLRSARRNHAAAWSAAEQRLAYERQLQQMRAAFDAIMSRLGLDQNRLVDVESGLRDLTIADLSPRVRVLYAFDIEAQRLLAFVGEPLTRSYYGDSVRLAEKLWREHRAQRSAEARADAR